MGILYILTLIILGISFMMFKKSNEKVNFIKWLIIYFVSLFGYNIVIGMILGLLNITSYIWLLSIINLLFAGILGYRVIRYKEIQKYFVRKLDIIAVVIILAIFLVMFIKDLYIFNGDITHFAIDSAIHYRAAKHYSDNLKIFINVEDKSFFNFNVMQTGAYINDGIFMNIINGITGLDHCYIYQIFETLVMFIGGMAFYVAIMDKIKTKRGLIGSLILFTLYMYGYPYNSWIYGFSYLSVGIAMVAMLITVVEALYSDEKINKILVISLIGILATGLIFSYSLFVPAIFASICIYTFLKDFSEDGKTYFKFFKKNTLIITGMLLVITIAGIGYIVVPTFFIAGQTNLIDALKIDGAIYSEKLVNLLPYIPFGVIFFIELVKKIKNQELRYLDIFSVCIMGYVAMFYLGMLYGNVSPYYMIKVYFILWIAIFAVTIDLLNKHLDEKIFRLDTILLVLLYVILVFKKVDAISIAKIYLVIWLIFYTALPEVIEKIDFEKAKTWITNKLKLNKSEEKKKFKINSKITPFVYVVIWGVFVFSWVWIKAGHIIGEEEKHSLPNLVGMYYSENCEYRKLIDLEHNFNKNEIELVKYARENLKDLNADNIQLITQGYYTRTWATALLEISSDNIKYEKFIQDPHRYTVEEAINDERKKYIVRVVSKNLEHLKEYNSELEEARDLAEVEILLENENGFVAKINR